MIPLLTLLACAPDIPAISAVSPTHPAADTGDDTGQPQDTGPVDDTAPVDDTGPVDTGPFDADEDGFTADVDCDDHDATTFPGADEVCGDGVVNDCDGTEADARDTCAHMLTDHDATAAWKRNGHTTGSVRLAGLGDVNGDGYADVGLGRVHTGYYDDEGDFIYDSGLVEIYNGPVVGDLNDGEEPDFSARFSSTPEYDYAAWDTIGVGDLDGDGYDDFAVGAPDVVGRRNTPSVYLVHGPVVGTIHDTDVVTLLGPNTEDHDCLGDVLAPTPDADGDGVTDLLVGGRCFGQAHLVSGAGEQLEPFDDDIAYYYVPELDDVDGNKAAMFGYSMAGGDLDGDGLVDAAIGAPQSYFVSARLGFVSIFTGPQSGGHSTEDADVTIAATLEDTWSPDYFEPEMQLGTSVAMGDWNHDGHDDLIAGAPLRGDETENADYWEGASYVYFGPLDQSAYGLPEADLTILGDNDNDELGGETDGDDDIDGDGVDDLLIGNGRYQIEGNTGYSQFAGAASRAWVILGPLTGGTMWAADADVIIYAEPYVENGYRYGGFGLQARVAGDTDGDGRKELLVGSDAPLLYLFDIGDVGGY